MPTAVVCPNCRGRVELAHDAGADEPIRCPQCVHVFLRHDSTSAHFQAGAAPLTATPVEEDPRDEERTPPRRPQPRPPIGLVPFLWVTVGVLLLLLAVSLGFNLWVFFESPDRRDRFDELVQAQRDAANARQRADQARQLEIQTQAQLEEVRRQLKQTEEQLEEARRHLLKQEK